MKVKKSTVVIILIVSILSALLVPVAAANPIIQPFYANTSSAKITWSFSNTGSASISILCVGFSGTTKIVATTYIEKQVGSTWVRVDIGTTNNQWVYTVNGTYLSKAYTQQLTTHGTYRAVTIFKVTRITTETITKTTICSY